MRFTEGSLKFFTGSFLSLLCLWVGQATWGESDVDDLSLWVPVTLELPVTDKVSASLQVESRLNNNIRDFSGLRIIPGIEYTLNKHVTLNTTYGWYPNFDEGVIENEHRLQQEIELSKKWPRFSVALGQRLEERFIEDVEGTALRSRTLITLKIPIKNSPWYMVSQEDLRINLNSPDNGPQAGFNQNRIFLGVGRTMGKATLEGGYQLRYENTHDSDTDELDHIVVIRLNYRLR